VQKNQTLFEVGFNNKQLI